MRIILTFLFLWVQISYAQMSLDVDILHMPPTAEEFVQLRAVAGLKPRTVESAQKGIANTLFWVTLRLNGNLIGMGRVIGDGGTVVQITDIAVHPNYQRKGYGTLILDQIQDYILREIPQDAFVCLFAEKPSAGFYATKGFVFLEEKWPGMCWPSVEREKKRQNIIAH